MEGLARYLARPCKVFPRVLQGAFHGLARPSQGSESLGNPTPPLPSLSSPPLRSLLSCAPIFRFTPERVEKDAPFHFMGFGPKNEGSDKTITIFTKTDLSLMVRASASRSVRPGLSLVQTQGNLLIIWTPSGMRRMPPFTLRCPLAPSRPSNGNTHTSQLSSA